MTDDPPLFDLCGPLPTGRTVLEASAGTGKTYTIAALAARYVAGGIPLEHLLIVTFTRAATSELRERVRERFVRAEVGLRLALDGIPPPAHDEVLQLLAAGDRGEIELRRQRLATALADFDAATIATTHGFCEHILSGLGVAGDVERDVTFVEDPSDLVAEVVDDLYVRHVIQQGYPGFGRKEAGEIAAKVVDHPTAPIEPSRAPTGSSWDKRARLGLGARMHVERRKLAARLLTYDDLLTRLEATLAHPVRGPAACRRLQDRYRVALVDEFQDTDPVQWDILRLAFGAGSTTMVLIGDPKQAIYSFRGADVFAYLDAAKGATKATLGTNWRSDQGLIEACQALFGHTTLGHPDIAFRTVQAAPAHGRPGLVGAPVATPLRVRMVHRLDGGVALSAKGYVSKGSGEDHIAADLAADLVALLGSGAKLVSGDGVGTVARGRLQPGHVAVLVRTNHQAAVVRDALDAVDIPAVINGAGSVFATPAARDWLRLVEALQRPSSPSRARGAALTSFLGWTAGRLAEAPDEALDGLQTTLYHWAAILDRRGVASLLEVMTRTTGLTARMLVRVDGERELTDLRHIGQLLHAEAITERLGTTALTTWLRRRITDADRDTGAAERSRRLDSDAEAVQVLTIHRSKGLEFPVVYAPYLWADTEVDDRLPVYHDREAGGRRTVDVGGKGGPDNERHRTWRKEEERGEELRLAYVALTRARHQVVLWWAGSWGSRCSPLGRLLFGRDADGAVRTELKAVPTDQEALDGFEDLVVRGAGTISVERVGAIATGHWGGAVHSSRALGVRRFDRTLDQDWQRTSYSALIDGAHAHGPAVASEPEVAEFRDEVLPAGTDTARAVEVGAAGEEWLRAVPSLWETLPKGAETGILVHGVLENTDFAAPDLAGEISVRVVEQVVRLSPGFVAAAALAAAVRAAVETPLGPLAGHLSLRQVTTADRLNELNFELPLAGGDTPAHRVSVGDIAALLRQRVAAGDPLAGYADALAVPGLDHRLSGFLTGSIDLVVRVPQPAGPDRYAVIDYKTNWLAVGDEPLTAWHYRPAALAAAMQAAHYPLQALLYSVALHRYLRWRLPDYDPGRHLAGVLYLFVRGMTGASAPEVGGQACGVFAWQPPGGLVSELSDLLDRGAGGP